MSKRQKVSSEQTTCPRCGNNIRFGALACPVCGLVFGDKPDTQMLDQAEATAPSCYRCGRPAQLGEMVCAGCGAAFDDDVDFAPPDDTNDFRMQLAEKTGPDFPSRLGISTFIPTTVTLDMNGIRLDVPTVEVAILGRGSQPENQEILVDLSPFGAGDKGVSRRHLIIRRRGTLIYVADLGSRNGTWLNGQRLVAHGERLLRNGDEIQLSRLKFRVMYHSWE
jgi:hypothetical protein